MNRNLSWQFVCELDELLPDSGVAALIDGHQFAIFRVGQQVYALDNFDPHSGVNVLSRGILGDMQGELVVASPVYKHHFSLITGRCLEAPEMSVRAYPARVADARIWVKSVPLRAVTGPRKLVVIGNGMAGMKVVEELLAIAPKAYDITVFGEEPHPNYNRILLSSLLAGEKKVDDIIINPLKWYRQHSITLHTGDPVVAIDRRRRVVRSRSGVEAPYDRLLLATGSKPIMLPVPGYDLPGVVTFRDLQDVNAMLQSARAHRKAIVIGGGLLGLEAANGLLKQGMDVTVVHIFDTLMERQLDRPAAALLRESLERRGMKFRMPAKTIAIIGNIRATGVQFEDGRELDA
ncbi:MAG: nitrite reductase small subunit NirD, partial [Steroidobacteraceae bacterium]